MITDIIFDWGGVLAPSTTRSIAKEISEKCDIDEEEAYKVIVDVESRYETVAEHEGFYKEISEKLCLDKKQIMEKLNNVSVGEVFHLAKTLSNKYKIHLLSNQVTPKAQAIRKANDLSFFKSVFFSNEIGLRKPSTEMFDFVLKMVKETAENILFVDDREQNTKAAKGHGIRTVTFSNLNQLKKDLKAMGITA